MGKRSKSQKSEGSPITKKKKSDLSNAEEIDDVNLNEVPVPSVPATSKQKKEKKGKNKTNPREKNADILNEDAKLDELVPQLEKIVKKKKLKKGISHSLGSSSSKSKKIVFVDDEPHEVPTSKQTTKSTDKKKFLNDDEAEVKDEDIDKFCDEIDEEDNKQYEDWVKLIEAKLHENKKSK